MTSLYKRPPRSIPTTETRRTHRPRTPSAPSPRRPPTTRRPRGASPCRRWKGITAADDMPEALARDIERAADAAAEVEAARRPAGTPPARPPRTRRPPTFDDSPYTTALDAAALTPQQRADAEKIAREIESGNLRVGADGLLAAAPHPDYDARQEGQLLSRQPTLDKTDPTLEEYEAMRKAQLAAGPPGLAPPSTSQSSPNGVEATSVSFDAEDDALDAALLDAGLANDLRTRDILRWEGIDAHSLMYLEYGRLRQSGFEDGCSREIEAVGRVATVGTGAGVVEMPAVFRTI